MDCKIGIIFSAKDPLHLLSQGENFNTVTDVVDNSVGQDCSDDHGSDDHVLQLLSLFGLSQYTCILKQQYFCQNLVDQQQK